MPGSDVIARRSQPTSYYLYRVSNSDYTTTATAGLGWTPKKVFHCKCHELTNWFTISRFTMFSSFSTPTKQWNPPCWQPFHTYAIYSVNKEYLQGATKRSLKALRGIHLSGSDPCNEDTPPPVNWITRNTSYDSLNTVCHSHTSLKGWEKVWYPGWTQLSLEVSNWRKILKALTPDGQK